MLLLATFTTFEIIAICVVSAMAGLVFGFAICAILSAGSECDDILELEADSRALNDIASVLAKLNVNAKYIDIIDGIDLRTCGRLAKHAHNSPLTYKRISPITTKQLEQLSANNY